ncbi:MAG: LysR substrate-binding domain-containing protein [Methyloligellaceae bacterium]
MNLKQLRAFREVMLTGSVSEAARNLYRTQPAISSLIANLEEDLNCELFSRRGGRLHPVPEAHYLFEGTSDLLSRLNTIEQNMKSLRDLEQGEISIVSMPGPSVFVLPELISRFVESRSGVRVTLTTRSSPQVQHLLSTQQHDVGVADMGSDGTPDSALVNHESFRFECLCAMRNDDPLAALSEITAEDLDGKPMAALQSDHESYVHTEAAFREGGCRFNLRFQTQYFLPLFTFVEAGQAYSIVDPLSAESYRIYRRNAARLAFRPFRPAISFVVSIMTPAHRSLSNLAKAFSQTLHEEVRRINSEAVHARSALEGVR